MAAASRLIDTTVHIEIPEGVRLGFRLAGPGTRAVAYAADVGVRIIVLWGAVWLTAVTLPFFAVGGLSWGVILLLFFLLEWGYGSLFEGLWNGQTPGKRITGLRVVREDGHAIGLYEAFARNLLRAADALPLFYAVGLATMSATRKLQRLGDLAAGTMVIHEGGERLRREVPDLDDAPRLTRDEMRAGWRPPERTLDGIHAFALRRSRLEPARAREIATILALPLARRLGYDENDARFRPDVFLLRVYRTFQGRP